MQAMQVGRMTEDTQLQEEGGERKRQSRDQGKRLL